MIKIVKDSYDGESWLEIRPERGFDDPVCAKIYGSPDREVWLKCEHELIIFKVTAENADTVEHLALEMLKLVAEVRALPE